MNEKQVKRLRKLWKKRNEHITRMGGEPITFRAYKRRVQQAGHVALLVDRSKRNGPSILTPRKSAQWYIDNMQRHL